jgi:diguanylate cyclase (GGDEF)-like protein
LGASIRSSAAAQALISRIRRTSRLLLASGLLVVLSSIWFVANLDHPRGPLLLLWLPQSLSTVILTLVYRRTSRAEQLPMPTRRFWRHLSVTAALVGMACVVQTGYALRDPFGGGQHTGPVMLAIDSCAVLVIVWALYRLPLGRQTRGERLRVGLDGGTVMLATAVFFWHFQTRPMLALGEYHIAELVGQAIVTVLALVAVFAVAKVVLSSYAFIDKAALRLLAFAMLAGSLTPMLEPYLDDKPYLSADQVGMPVVLFVAAWAGERQRTAGQDPARPAARGARRRPFSVLPYLAVAAVDGLLLAVNLSAENLAGLAVAAGAIVLTGVVVVRQITAFQDNGRLLARLDHSATHDALTQLPNRVLFGKRLQKALSTPGDRPVSVALIDLDDFKIVNDTLGHETGDVLLIEAARRLAACVRAQDTVARLGGDEFVVVLDGIDRAGADATAERIIAALTSPVVADGHELRIRASIGIADGRSGDDASRLLRQADIAMYAAKRSGGGYLHYEPGMAGTGADDAHLSAELREAITDNQFFLLYQPIVALDGGRLAGVEALVRWAHPVRGVLPPAEFIPLAERSGLIVPLGRWILREACRQIAAWQTEHGEAAPAVINVNVSARELREAGFADGVAAALTETGVPAHRLVLEITETTVFELGASVANLRALRALGIRIALDDFGTGHSTLTLLQDCPVDELKLDRSFAQVDPGAKPTIATAVIHLARVLGLHVVAEGVETPQQADRLRVLGYEAAQGFYFARPMPAAQISQAIRAPEPGDLVPNGRS